MASLTFINFYLFIYSHSFINTRIQTNIQDNKEENIYYLNVIA